MQNVTETELIARSLDGDSEAYGELVSRYKNAIYYHCFAIVRDEDAAEDIAQETFINAYYKLKQYNNIYRLSTWLFKISTNKCLTHLKRRGRELATSDEVLASFPSEQPTPSKHAIHAELHTAVRALRPNYRAVISLYYWQGLDYATTAQVMDVPINSVRVWLKRAKEELKKELS
jgi:RNA polymerase sigma-70 factor (ECF subfamily)